MDDICNTAYSLFYAFPQFRSSLFRLEILRISSVVVLLSTEIQVTFDLIVWKSISHLLFKSSCQGFVILPSQAEAINKQPAFEHLQLIIQRP